MKANEIIGKKEIPHLYLDMDGVTADFFGEWARHHNVPTYKHIPNREEAIDILAHSSPKQVYTFFRELPPLKGGLQIINWLKSNKVPFTVLSAPLKGPYSKYSIQAKKDWLDQYNPGTSNDAIFTGDKFLYAVRNGKPNVLVDDFGKYINAWREAGGIGIKHDDVSTGTTIKQLEKLYLDK
jgi:5'(3')-deoxyribonucleotidase